MLKIGWESEVSASHINPVSLLPEWPGDLNAALRSTGRIKDGKLSAGQEEDVQQVLESGTIAPSLTCIYGEDDQISMVNVDQGSILGSRLGSLLSLHSLMNMRHNLMN